MWGDRREWKWLWFRWGPGSGSSALPISSKHTSSLESEDVRGSEEWLSGALKEASTSHKSQLKVTDTWGQRTLAEWDSDCPGFQQWVGMVYYCCTWFSLLVKGQAKARTQMFSCPVQISFCGQAPTSTFRLRQILISNFTSAAQRIYLWKSRC